MNIFKMAANTSTKKKVGNLSKYWFDFDDVDIKLYVL